ncbi:hypothetical protein [Roseibium sediminis]|uniref:hypothetical protein n=1 Tax=Roseibium sediminis TaxID=1775174 RepID=UPI00123C8964|nr:hypothetical protein [Roseibium sediminis]
MLTTSRFCATDLDKVQGWAFQKTFEFLVLDHPEVWPKWREAKHSLPTVDLDFEGISGLFPGGIWPAPINLETAFIENPKLQIASNSEVARAALLEIFSRYNDLIELFRGGYLIANRFDHDAGKIKLFTPSFWASGKIHVELKDGHIFEEYSYKKAKFENISVSRRRFDLGSYHKKSLSDVFRNFVLFDRSLAELEGVTNHEPEYSTRAYKPGVFWEINGGSLLWWPMWLRYGTGPLPNHKSSKSEKFDFLLSDLLNVFLAPLENGEVVATGLNNSDQLIPIPPTFWTCSELFLHASNHSIGWQNDTDNDGARTEFQVRFTDVVLNVDDGALKSSIDCVPDERPTAMKASDAEIERLLTVQFENEWRKKADIVDEINDQTRAGKRRIVRVWDYLVKKYPNRSKPGPRKK